ncbi:hypothetical protein BGZ65_000444, partial [Modicella reniformis]
SAKVLSSLLAKDQGVFLRELIPTPSEITNKLDAAIRNARTNARLRLRVMLDFDGSISIQSSRQLSETNDFKDSVIVIILDKQPTQKDNQFLYHKTTEREVYNEAQIRN